MNKKLYSLAAAAFILMPFSSTADPNAPQCKQEDPKKTEEQAKAQHDLAQIRGEEKLTPPTDCPKPDFPDQGGNEKEPEKANIQLRTIGGKIPTKPSGSRDFDFKYGYVPRPGAKRTVVYIKGGPNSGSWIDNTGKDEFKDCNLIVVELPGAGYNKFCENAKGGSADKGPAKNCKMDPSVDIGKEIQVEKTAELVKDIVKKEGLSDYVIAGHSYGTTVATAATSMISKDKSATKPKGVLLMGTVGKATEQKPGGHEVTEGPKRVSNKAYGMLSAQEQEKFKQLVNYANSPSEAPRGANKIAGAFLGPMSGNFNIGLKFMRDMLKLSPEKAMQCMNSSRPPSSGGEPSPEEMEYAQAFYENAGCEMISGKLPVDESHFFNDVLITKRPNACYCSSSPNIGTYDSAKWQIKDVPIYYVKASDDFNTAPNQQEYHQRYQSGTKSTVFENSGGHGLGFSQFGSGQCSSALNGIFDGNASAFSDGMKACTARTRPQANKTSRSLFDNLRKEIEGSK